MNTTSIARTLRTGTAIAATLFAALSAQAGDLGQDTYKRVVLGDTSIAAPQAVEATTRVVPGSYARYLIKNGMDQQQALATAAATGEVATVEKTTDNVAVETSRQRYERVMGIVSIG